LYHTEEQCSREYRKYYDTVMVSSAIFDLFKDGTLGKFVGESHQLRTQDNTPVTPDITTVYDSGAKGLLFEIKYSLGSSASDSLLRLKRYFGAKTGWRTATGTVDDVDVVLICNADDTQSVHEALEELARHDGNEFLKAQGFALWQWIVTSSKKDERAEVMWLQPIAGSCRNEALEERIRHPGGIRISDKVLEFLRFQHSFVRDKPPVQYTILFLLQHVLPKDPDKEWYDVPLEIVYQRANSFFPAWWESTETTTQVKRGWIKEALSTLRDLGLIQKRMGEETYTIPTSLLAKKKPLRLICRRLAQRSQRHMRRSRVVRKRAKRVTPVKKETSTLEPYIQP